MGSTLKSIGFLEIRFAGVEEHQFLLIMPPGGAHELDGEVLNVDGNPPPTARFMNVADFILAWLSAAQCRLDGGESVRTRQADDLDVIAEQFVLNCCRRRRYSVGRAFPMPSIPDLSSTGTQPSECWCFSTFNPRKRTACSVALASNRLGKARTGSEPAAAITCRWAFAI